MHKYFPPILVCHYHPNKSRYLYIESKRHVYPGEIFYIKTQDASASFSFRNHLERINSQVAYLARIKMANYQLYVHLAHRHALVHNNGVIMPSYYSEARARISGLSKQVYNKIVAPHRPRSVSPSVLSLALKHKYAFSYMLRYSIPWAIIAEDDIVFKQNTAEMIMQLFLYFNNSRLSFDGPVFVDLAGGCNLKPYSPDSRQSDMPPILKKLEIPVTRTTCAYLININFASQFLYTHPSLCTAIDCELTDFMLRSEASSLAVNCYWLDPTAFLHGSEIGQYRSTILH